MLTVSWISADKIKAFHHGANDYSLKPFSPSDLLVGVQSLKITQFVAPAFALEGEQRAAKVSG